MKRRAASKSGSEENIVKYRSGGLFLKIHKNVTLLKTRIFIRKNKGKIGVGKREASENDCYRFFVDSGTSFPPKSAVGRTKHPSWRVPKKTSFFGPHFLGLLDENGSQRYGLNPPKIDAKSSFFVSGSPLEPSLGSWSKLWTPLAQFWSICGLF